MWCVAYTAFVKFGIVEPPVIHEFSFTVIFASRSSPVKSGCGWKSCGAAAAVSVWAVAAVVAATAALVVAVLSAST